MKSLKFILSMIIIVTSILIGTPILYNCIYINIAINCIGVIFVTYNFLKKKKVLNKKLDIIVLILCMSPLIPIIFNTYISLTDSIIYLLKYSSCFVVYLLSKYLVQEDEKNKELLTNMIIISSVILCIIGIDGMTTRMFTTPLEKVGIPYVVNIEGRMFSSLGYVNSFAIILVMSIILAIDKIVNNEKYKAIYSGFIFLNLFCLILTCSRTSFVLMILGVFIYIIIKHSKYKTINVLYTFIINGTLSLLYLKMWSNIVSKEEYVILWIMTIIMFSLSIILQKLVEQMYEYISKIPTKKYIIFIMTIIIIAIVAVPVGTKLTKPLSIFSYNTSSKTVKFKISNIEPNKEYSFKFDIEAKSLWKNNKNYSIIISEENKYYDEVDRHEISFNDCNNVEEIKFKTSNETNEVAILFESKNRNAQLGLTVKSFTINNEEHPLKYLYLPTNLIEKIKAININNKSIWERGSFYKDSLKIIKDNIFFGIGGNGWRYKYINVQSYNYSSTEIHNYLLQVFMDYGIIAIVALVIMLIHIFVKFAKNLNEEYLAIGIIFAVLISHSFMDFDMSFYFIMILAFILIGILSLMDRQEICLDKANIKYIIIVNIFLIFSILFGVINISYTKNRNRVENEMASLMRDYKYNEVMNIIKQNRKTEKYELYYDKLQKIDYNFVTEENINYIYEILRQIPISVNVEYNMQKNETIERILNTCDNQEIKHKFAQIIINENDEMMKIINNKEINRITSKKIKLYELIQKNIFELAKQCNIV